MLTRPTYESLNKLEKKITDIMVEHNNKNNEKIKTEIETMK